MILAADLQDPPELILEMLAHWKNGSRYVIAVRESREDPFLSKIFSRVYYWLLRNIVVPDYPRGGFDLALMDAQLLAPLRDSGKNINTPLLSYWLGYNPVVVQYQRRKREHGKSRWTFSKRMVFLIDSLLGFSVLPLRLMSLIGLLISFMSFGYGITVTVGALLGNRDVAGFPTLVALFTFLLGFIIVMLGIIGEYLWRIFDQLNRRPEAIIDEVY